MKNFKNQAPIYVEAQIINGEKNIHETLAQFKQLIPINFIQLETRGKNYMCSTQGWKEPACERYIFFDNHNKSVQLDIPQELMVELGLSENEDKNINYPIYISPEVLKRTPIQLGINIKNKGEIFIQKPLTINNLEPELTNWLEEIQLLKTELQGEKQLSQAQQKNHKNKIKLLQDTLQEKENKIRELESEKERLNNDWQNRYQQELNKKSGEITELKQQKEQSENNLKIKERKITESELKRNDLEKKLEQEKDWWDKWFNDSDDYKCYLENPKWQFVCEKFFSDKRDEIRHNRIIFTIRLERNASRLLLEGSNNVTDGYNGKSVYEDPKDGKKIVKLIYEYYKNN